MSNIFQDADGPVTIMSSPQDKPGIGVADIASAIPLAAVGAADTVVSSLSLGYLDNNLVSETLLNNGFGNATGLFQRYKDNEEGYKLAGEIGVAFIGAGAAVTSLKAAQRATSVARAAGYVKRADDGATFGGYISGEAAATLGNTADNLSQLRHMFAMQDVRMAQQGVVNLRGADRAAALSNIRRTGVVETAGELAAGTAAELALLNQSEALFPEGMTAQEYIATTAFFGTLGFGGTLLRTAGAARAAGREAGLAKATLEFGASTPLVAAAGEEGFAIAAAADMRKISQGLAATAEVPAAVREAHISRSNVLAVEMTEKLKTFAAAPDPVFASPAKLTAEQINTVRDSADGSLFVGLRSLRNSEDTLFDQAGRRKDASASLRKQIAELEDVDDISIRQNDQLVKLREQLDYVSTQKIVHVMPDGIVLADGDAPVSLAWRGGQATFRNEADGVGNIAVRSNHRADDAATVVGFDFSTNMTKPWKAELLDLNKLALGYSKMLDHPTFGEQLSRVKAIKVNDLGDNPMALAALLKHTEGLDAQASADFLRKLKLPDEVDNLDAMRDWAVVRQAQIALDMLHDKARQAKRLRKTVVEPFEPYELSLRTGLRMHDESGKASGLMEHLLGQLQNGVKTLPKGLDEQMLRELAANTAAIARTTDPVAVQREAARPLTFDVIGYKWGQKPVAMALSGQEQDAALLLTMNQMRKDAVQQRLARLDRSESAVLGETQEVADAVPGSSIVSRINETIKSLGTELKEKVSLGAAGVLAGQERNNTLVQGFTGRQFQLEEVFNAPHARALLNAAQREKNQYIQDTFSPIYQKLRELAEPTMAGDQFSFNSYLAAMKLQLPVKPGLSNGKILVDTDNPAAIKIWNNLFPETPLRVGQTAYLPDPAMLARGVNQPLTLTGAAQNVVEEMQRLVALDLLGKNQVRYAAGLNQIADRPHYLPYVQHENMHQVFISDKTGSVIAMTAGSTLDAAKQRAADFVAQRTKQYPSEVFNVIDAVDVKRYREAHGEAVRNNISVSTEGMSKGEIANMMKVDSSNNLAKAYVDELQSAARGQVVDTIRLHFLDDLKALQMNAKVAKTELETTRLQGQTAVRFADDAFTLFEEALTGYSASKPDSWTARLDDAGQRIFQPIGDSLDKFSEKTFGKLGSIFDQLRGKAPKPQEWAAIGKKVQEEIGYNPIGDAMERMASTANYRPPNDVRDNLQAAQGMASYFILKLADASYAAMNAISPLTTSVGHMSWLKRLPDESEAMHANRVGAMAYAAQGQAIPTPHGIMLQGLQEMKAPEFLSYYNRFTERPTADGELLNMFRNVNRPASEATSMFSRIFNGETGYATALGRKGDNFGQAYAHSMAYAMLKRSGIDVDDPMVQAMASHIGGKMNVMTPISDRADVFKTLPGMPFGLFQTFANNYLQNTAQMIERGDMRSVFKQYAMQGLIFGMHSVPGWQQMQDYTFRSWDGEKSLDDQVSERLGRGMYDVVMNGPLWSVPKLFDGHGFGLYTRGDANIRPALGQINNLAQLPVIGLAKNAFDGLAATVKLASAGGNDQAAFEALVRSSPNRPIKGLLEVLQGYATDRGGQMTFEATQDWSASVYRLLGAKTSTEIEAARLSWQIKGVEAKRRAEIAKLRVEAQAYIRAADYDKLNEFAERYVQKGGNLESFNRWFKETARMAVATRTDRELQQAMKKATSFNELVQLSDAQTSR